MMSLLMRNFSQAEPTFAVGMSTSGAGGQIRVGDEISLPGRNRGAD